VIAGLAVLPVALVSVMVEAFRLEAIKLALLGASPASVWSVEPVAALHIAVLAVHQGHETCRGDGCCGTDPVSSPAASTKARDAWCQ